MADMASEVEKLPRILIVAGSDSSGGAGIQADLKTVTALGGYGMTAITAITAQNTLGVHDIHAVPVQTICAQMQAALFDIGADAVKTGMLATREVIEAVAETLATDAGAVPCVVDPVMVATSGDKLLAENAIGALKSLLVNGAALVTPNAPEAELLTGKAVEDVNGQRRAAEALLEAGAKAALVKGGHVDGKVISDVLQTQYGEHIFEGPRIDSNQTHGTGCTLASGVATLVGAGKSLPDAVDEGRAYLFGAIQNAPGFGAGQGPVHHGWKIKQIM